MSSCYGTIEYNTEMAFQRNTILCKTQWVQCDATSQCNSIQCSVIQCSSDTMQFRYNAVQRDGSGWQSGGPGAVGGHACGAIRGHRTASLLYFVFCIYVKFRKKHVHKLAHFYNEEGIDSKGDKSKMMNFHQPVISSAASSWRSLLKDQHHCLQVIHNIISICWYILRLPQGEVKGKYWYILVNIGKYW